MRVNQIIPFSVVILLITVSFAGIAAAAAPSEVGAIGTQLNATANVITAPVNTSFTINGTLSATGGTPIAGATIQLQNSTDNVTFTNVTVAPTTTDSNGNYSFSNSESVAGPYYYRTTYAGYSTDYYANATSNGVKVTVTAQTTSNTKLTAVATPTSVPYNAAQFTISGALENATPIVGITGATVTLENANTSAVINTTTTGANGNYAFSQSESAVGTYYFQTTYAGNASYNSTTSNVVNVTVTPIATSLNATANVSTTKINTPFTINGTLSENPSGAPIAGQTITLQVSTNTLTGTLQGIEDGTWTNVTTTTTNSSGFYQFNLSEPVAGHYWYRTAYDGNAIDSNAIGVVVGGVQVGTQTSLTAAANVTSTVVNAPFTISGKLSNATSGNGIYNQTITLQQNESGTWTTVANTATDTNGNYSFSPSEPAPGIYQFQTTYAGNGEFSNATSAVVSVNVSTTQLSIAVAPNTTEINTNFTINGTLSNATSVGIPNATIQLQSSTDNATFTNVTTNVTNASGFYTFNQSEPTLNIYYFRTTYAGNATLGNATSTVVSVLVNTVGTTQLTANATPGIVPVNVNFTISGTLNDTSGTPISGATITLKNNSTSTVIATTTTDSNGNYSFSHNESALGTYGYKTAYAGYLGISGTTSNEVNVTVTNVTTQLTAAANVTLVNGPFTISGTLSTTNGTTPGPIANATIIFKTSPGGATIATTTTNASGNYAFNKSESTIGTYHYLTTYAGNTTDYYASATSPVVTVQVGPPTTLTATANVTTTGINTPFTINGTLSVSSVGLSGQIITLQKNVSGTWQNVAGKTNTTTSTGTYRISTSEPTAGAYQYRTTYAGTPSILPATSNVVNVTVGPQTTRLSAVATPTTINASVPFTINGTLNDTSGPISGATIQLQKNVSGTWQNVAGKTNTTTSTGAYRISTSEPTAGAYQYRTIYAGNVTYTNATSNVVSVNVQPIITPTSSPAIVDSLYLFVRGSDNAIWYKQWDGTAWSNATSLGGNCTSAPAATSPSNGVIDVFAQGTNGALYERTTTNGGTTWSGWTSLGGVLAANSAPAATSPSNGVIDVFAQGTNGALYERTTTNGGTTWSGWTSLGGVLAANSGPAATSSGSVTYVFAHGTDNAVWYKDWNGTAWSSWHSLGGVLATGSAPAATSPSTGVIDVFAQGTTAAVYERTTTNGGTTWSGWTSQGGILMSSPPVMTSPAATSESGQVYIAALGINNNLWWKTTTSSWRPVGGI
jgi:5-hydroxyisourate hydrolase-like protein (transthyretin family)